jgi:hypothetical protein
MSKDITEQIDDICSSEYGHTNWVFADTLSEKELKEIKDKKLGDKMPSIVFYYEEYEGMSYEDICYEKFGHFDWVLLSTLSDEEKVGLDDVAEIETINGEKVVFYFYETVEEEIQDRGGV